MSSPNISSARECAYDAFSAVMAHKKKPEELLEETYRQFGDKLSRLDRNFIKELLYGSLRWYQKLYWILQNTSKRDLDKSPMEIRAALVLGTYQIYYMDRVPDRAAVNESVEYVRKKGQASACSFVNGILRQISRRAQYFAKPDKNTKPVEYLALQFSHPSWLVKQWSRRFKFEKLETLLSANNKPPPVSIRVNSLKTPGSQNSQFQTRLLKEEKTHSDKRPLRTSLRLTNSPVLAKESLFGQGYYTIQDEASQLIGFLVNPQQEENIVDSCAGPGGKLSHIYELGGGEITLTALDSSPSQLEKAQATCQRLGFDKISWQQIDFLEWQPTEKPDKILLDAPCSGFGVFRRHPEGKWHKTPDAPDKYSKIQSELIDHALRNLKVGGELIYSVCSFEGVEIEKHVDVFLEKYGDALELISPISRLPDYFKKYVTRKNILIVYSGNQDEMDGFGSFIFKLKAPIA